MTRYFINMSSSCVETHSAVVSHAPSLHVSKFPHVPDSPGYTPTNAQVFGLERLTPFVRYIIF